MAYTFEVAGLYNGLFVMADRATGSIWTHYDGTVLIGPLAGRDIALTIQPMIHVTWEQWLGDHPDTLVLDWYEEYADNYRENVTIGRGGLSRGFESTILNFDERLPENELVLGAGIGDDFSAYPLYDTDGLTTINDSLDGQPIVVFLDPGQSFGLAYSAVVFGETRTFSVNDGEIVDDSGTTWDLEGNATSGPAEGASLTYVTSFITEWYGWAAYHPETSIYSA